MSDIEMLYTFCQTGVIRTDGVYYGWQSADISNTTSNWSRLPAPRTPETRLTAL